MREWIGLVHIHQFLLHLSMGRLVNIRSMSGIDEFQDSGAGAIPTRRNPTSHYFQVYSRASSGSTEHISED